MSQLTSEVNMNDVGLTGNTGKIKKFLEPALVIGAVLVPKGFYIHAAKMISQSIFDDFIKSNTDTTTGIRADTRKNRLFAIYQLDNFSNGTKAASSEDTGNQQNMIGKYAPVFNYRYMTGMGNFIEILDFHNCQDFYDIYLLDKNGTWQGTHLPGNRIDLYPFTLQQFFVEDRDPATDKTANKYPVSIRLADNREINENFGYYAAGTDISSLVGLENMVITDVTADIGTALGITATTDFVISVKIGQDSTDFIELYHSDLDKTCFKAFDTTSGALLTISTMSFSEIADAGGQTIWYGHGTLSAAPTAGHKVRISGALPSAINALIPGANVVNELPNTIKHSF